MIKKYTFKIISILLIATFILSFVQTQNITQVSACFEYDTEYEGDWAFQDIGSQTGNGDELILNVTGFRGNVNSKKVTVPSKLKNIPVESISLSLFSHTNITDVEIPDSVKEITSFTLSEHSENITRTSKIRNINVSENNENYSSVNGILYDKSKTILIKYPSGRPEKSYRIPSHVTTIGYDAFYGASNLETVTIPKNVTTIQEIKSYRMSKETQINPFYKCAKLKSIKVAKDHPSFTSQNGILYNKKLSTLLKYPEGKTQKTFKIPNNVKTIRTNALHNCKNLKNLNVPKNTTSIQSPGYSPPFLNDSFERIDVDKKNKKYSSLNGVLYNKKKTSILYYPSNNKQKSYKMPKSVKNYNGITVFINKNLQTITLNRNINSFYLEQMKLPALKNIHVSRDNKKLSSKNGVLYDKKKTWLISYPDSKPQKTYTIPNSVQYINEDVFKNNKKLENFKVSKKHKHFSTVNGVLLNKKKTTIIKYPAGNKRKTYTTPSSVTTVKEKAFTNANNLVTINISKKITNLNENQGECIYDWDIFTNCKKLKNIKVNKDNKAYTDINGILYDKEKIRLINYPRGKTQKSYTIPKSVIVIIDNFKNHKHLKNLISTSKVFKAGVVHQNNKTIIQFEFKFNDGSTTLKKVNINQGERAKSYTPTKPGHRFTGWYTDTSFNQKFNFNINTYEVRTVYAKFEKI